MKKSNRFVGGRLLALAALVVSLVTPTASAQATTTVQSDATPSGVCTATGWILDHLTIGDETSGWTWTEPGPYARRNIQFHASGGGAYKRISSNCAVSWLFMMRASTYRVVTCGNLLACDTSGWLNLPKPSGSPVLKANHVAAWDPFLRQWRYWAF